MKLAAIMLTFGIAGSAHALTPQNLTCEMPGLGLAAFITGFDGRYQVFDWWDKTGDTLGMKAVVYADCKGGQSLRATTDQSSDTLDAATDILWTAGRAGQSGDLAALTAALQDAGFAVDTQPLATDHCACTDEMIGLSGQ
ncbi:hypothetical protein [Tabrizicola sp.]|uniref:hypothetical protein n=1 Tax=Tabrizicola sp. TaxID=2005166 RepID=UPI00286A63F4|nr:hypothetical protein [Tabrizicola sp.]